MTQKLKFNDVHMLYHSIFITYISPPGDIVYIDIPGGNKFKQYKITNVSDIFNSIKMFLERLQYE